MSDTTTDDTAKEERRGGPLDRRNPSLAERVILKVLFAMLLIGATCAAGLFGFGLIIDEIQNQRYEALVLTCEETNNRHDDVNKKIDEAVAAVPIGPERNRAEENAGPFRLIITAAVPKTEDCDEYASDRVKGILP